MAKADLALLVQKAAKHLEGSSERLRAKYNTRPHVFVAKPEALKSEILTQIGRIRKITKLQDDRLNEAISKYIGDLYDTFKFRPSKTFTYNVQGTKSSFYVVVTSDNPNSNIFDKIYRIRTEKSRLQHLKDAVISIFRDANISNVQNLFDLGHTRGHSVSEVRVQEALHKFSNLDTRLQVPEVQSIIKLALRSREGANMSKLFTLEVTDESAKGNRSKGSTEEIALLNRARKVLSDFLDDNVDWFKQKGSRSAEEIAVAELAKIVRRRGGKVTGKVNTSRSQPSEATAKVITKRKSSKPVIQYATSGNIGKVGTESTNWNRLLPIINSRLKESMVSNMQYPSLVNRTGRLAGSARVVGVERSPQGFATLVFEYERNPYDVFDRSLGKSPWNTPARDPKTLVAKSIRDIVTEMVTERFYTRRA